MRLIKKTITMVLFGLLMVGGYWIFPAGASGKPLQLRALTAWPVNHPVNAMYTKFINTLNKRSGGQFNVRLIGGPEVVSVKNGLKAVMQGTVDLLHGDPHYYGGELPITQIFGYVRPVRGEALKVLKQPGVREFMQEATRNMADVIFLGIPYEQPFYIQTVKKPAIRPEDFKGLKLRSPGGLYAKVLKATGATPVRVASAETYEALQRGVVDGTMRNTLSLRHFKEYEVIRYIMLPAFICARTMIVISADTWDKLSPEMQKLFNDTSAEFGQATVEYWWNKDATDMKWMLDQKVIETVKMSKEASQILSKAREHAIDKLAELIGTQRARKLQQYFGPYVK